ncbi:MAG: HEAT repeat domain-containing protein [Anaerolineae bacterium]|jgi:HEAT repeat protein|nr:HEAT repeat domain-containing protein [Anaerolineae bacterium]
MFLRKKLTPHDIENMRKDGNMRGLVRALQSKESPAYMAAFQELSRIKPSPIKEVLPLTQHRDKLIRYRAVRLLGEMEDPLAIPEVARILVEQQSDPQMVIFATTALDLLDWTPTHDRAGALYFCRKREWMECVPCGASAVDPLIDRLLHYLQPEEGEEFEAADVEQISKALAKIGDPAIQPVARLLFDTPPVVTSAAQNILLRMGKKTVAHLVDLLNDSQQEATCLILVDLLHKLRDERAAPAIVQKLLSAAPRCQKACTDALSEFGEHTTAQELVKAQQIVIEHTVWNTSQAGYDVRMVENTKRQLGYIERALSAIGAPALEILLQHFDTDNVLHLDQMMNVIERMGTIVYDPIVAKLSDPRALVRERVVRMLKRLRWEPETTLEKAEFFIASRQWEALPALGAAAVEPLQAAMRYDTYPYRINAAEILSAIDAPLSSVEDTVYQAVFTQQFESLVSIHRGAVKPLLHLLQEAVEPDSPHRSETLRVPLIKGITQTLTALGSDAVVDLVMVLEQQPNYMRVYAVNILTAIGESTIPLLINTVRKHEDIQVVELAAQALTQIKETPVNFYRDCLMNRSPQLRRIGVKYFAEHPDPTMLRQLLLISQEENGSSQVRVAAIRALGAYPQEQVLPVLKDTLFLAQQPELQIAALQALKERGVLVEDMGLIGLMVDQITIGDGTVARNAAAALGAVGSTSAVSILMDLLKQYEGQLAVMVNQTGAEQNYRHMEQQRSTIVRVLAMMQERAVATMFHRCAEDALPWLDSYQEVFLKIGEPAREQLIAELTSPFFYRRRLAARLLNHLNWTPGNSETAAAFMIARERWEDVEQYGMQAVNPLLELLDADQEKYQKQAAELLEKIGWKPEPNQTGCRYWIAKGEYRTCIVAGAMAVIPLVQAMERIVIELDARKTQDPSEVTRRKGRLQAIKEALHGIGPEGVPVIAQLFTSPTTLEILRPHLSHVLVYADRPEGKHLLAALMDKNTIMAVRQQAAFALGEMACVNAIQPLFDLVRKGSPNPRLMQDCMKALLAITKQTNQQAALHQIRQTMQTILGTGEIKEQELRQIGTQVVHICNHRLKPDRTGSTGLQQ